MKTKTSSPSQPAAAAFFGRLDESSLFDEAPVVPGAVRIFLGLDVPQAALPQIESACSLIAHTQRVAPELVPKLVAAAWARLQEHPLRLSGLAAIAPMPNPLERHARRALAKEFRLAA